MSSKQREALQSRQQITNPFTPSSFSVSFTTVVTVCPVTCTRVRMTSSGFSTIAVTEPETGEQQQSQRKVHHAGTVHKHKDQETHTHKYTQIHTDTQTHARTHAHTDTHTHTQERRVTALAK